MGKEQIKKAIAEAVENDPNKKDILSVSLFGSYAYGTPTPDSDIDILIEFKEGATVGYFKLARIQRNMRESVGEKLNLITPQALSKYFREEVLRKAEPIYG